MTDKYLYCFAREENTNLLPFPWPTPAFPPQAQGFWSDIRAGVPRLLSAPPNPPLHRRPDAYFQEQKKQTTSARLAERVTRGKEHPQRHGSARQAAWGARSPDTYKLPVLQIVHSLSHTVQGLFGGKKKKNLIYYVWANGNFGIW